MRPPLFVRAAVLALLIPSSRLALADDAVPLVHPIYAHLPDAPEEDAQSRAFTAAAVRYGLRPVEVVDVPAPPEPRAPDLLKIGMINVQKLAFADAWRDLDAGVAEVEKTGGAGISAEQLADLYLFRGMATAHVDWNQTAADPPTEGRTHAYADYLRAATVLPTRKPSERETPPQAMADFQRAAAEVQQRPRGTLLVAGSADAQVSLDGAPLTAVAGGVTFRDLVYGYHLLHVEEVGHVPWGTVVHFEQPTSTFQIPARPAVALDATTAVAHARRMGARFALVAQPIGGPAAGMNLHLVDVNGTERDAAQIPAGSDAAVIDAAVLRLDEQARRIALDDAQKGALAPPPAAASGQVPVGPPILLAPPPPKVSFHDDPMAWARDHWPLLTAIGVVAVSSIVLGAAVASDR
jgi:hypothetical protein